MENNELDNLLSKLMKFGVVHREAVKHHTAQLKSLLKKRYVQKNHQKGKVFYEFTEHALSLLDDYRQRRLLELKTLNAVYPRNKVYAALLKGDLRFLDDTNPKAEEFRFLSDWQLRYPVKQSQLALSQARYFDQLNNLEE